MTTDFFVLSGFFFFSKFSLETGSFGINLKMLQILPKTRGVTEKVFSKFILQIQEY